MTGEDDDDGEWKPPNNPSPWRPVGHHRPRDAFGLEIRELDYRNGSRTMNRTELVATIAARLGQSPGTVDMVLDGFFEVLADSVGKGVKVTIPGWLSAERVRRAARLGRNPQTGAQIEIAAGWSVKLTSGSRLRASAE